MLSWPIDSPPSHLRSGLSFDLDLLCSDDVTHTPKRALAPSPRRAALVERRLLLLPLLLLPSILNLQHGPRARTTQRTWSSQLPLSHSVLGRIAGAPQTRSHPQTPRFDRLGARHCPAPPRTKAGSKIRRKERRAKYSPLCIAATLQRTRTVWVAQPSFPLPHAAPAWIIDPLILGAATSLLPRQNHNLDYHTSPLHPTIPTGISPTLL